MENLTPESEVEFMAKWMYRTTTRTYIECRLAGDMKWNQGQDNEENKKT